MLKLVEKKSKNKFKSPQIAGRPLLDFLSVKKHFAFKSGSRPLCLDPEPLAEAV
jgi:hypothetical protein